MCAERCQCEDSMSRANVPIDINKMRVFERGKASRFLKLALETIGNHPALCLQAGTIGFVMGLASILTNA